MSESMEPFQIVCSKHPADKAMTYLESCARSFRSLCNHDALSLLTRIPEVDS